MREDPNYEQSLSEKIFEGITYLVIPLILGLLVIFGGD